MDHIPEQDLPSVSDDTRAVVRDAKAARAWIFGCGLARQPAKIVSSDGSVVDRSWPETKPVIGGFVIVEVSKPQQAIAWAERFAKACRCKQEVREIMYDPES